MKTRFILFFLLFILVGCNKAQISSTKTISLVDKSQKVAIYALKNYTDTPRAGMRASNIIEGVLLSNGYHISNRISSKTDQITLKEKIEDAKEHKIRYIIIGGVSEWRYKTGIDGEPAISLQFKIIDIDTKDIIWSAIGSDSSWGNDSIGTVAQNLISSMIYRR